MISDSPYSLLIRHQAMNIMIKCGGGSLVTECYTLLFNLLRVAGNNKLFIRLSKDCCEWYRLFLELVQRTLTNMFEVTMKMEQSTASFVVYWIDPSHRKTGKCETPLFISFLSSMSPTKVR